MYVCIYEDGGDNRYLYVTYRDFERTRYFIRLIDQRLTAHRALHTYIHTYVYTFKHISIYVLLRRQENAS